MSSRGCVQPCVDRSDRSRIYAYLNVQQNALGHQTMRDHFDPPQPTLTWCSEPDRPDRRMELRHPFSYKDPKGKTWEVPWPFMVDGASIPAFLWSTVGAPYAGDYRRASIVHDYWCQQGGWSGRLAADRMFRCACLDGGCTPKQAWLLYVGVRIGAYLPFLVAVVGADVGYPTLDPAHAGAPRADDEPLLAVFRRAAAQAAERDYPREDDALAERIDRTVEEELKQQRLLPRDWQHAADAHQP